MSNKAPSNGEANLQTDFEKLNACAKRPTDIWTNYLYYTFSLRFVYMIRKTRISPNGLTLSSLVLVLIGCVLYATGIRSDVVIGLILIQISYVVDCADGQLARYKQQYSPIGGWLDQTADRIKEFVLLFSLTYGYTRFHANAVHLWMWAFAALFFLYLLEYFEQIDMFREHGVVGVRDYSMPKETENAGTTTDSFSRMRRYRALIPFRGFIIGEQYFAMLLFVAFNAIYAYLVFVAILGGLMAIYRPLLQFIKHRRSQKAKITSGERSV